MKSGASPHVGRRNARRFQSQVFTALVCGTLAEFREPGLGSLGLGQVLGNYVSPIFKRTGQGNEGATAATPAPEP